MSLNVNSKVYIPSQSLIDKIKQQKDSEIIRDKLLVNKKIANLRVVYLVNNYVNKYEDILKNKIFDDNTSDIVLDNVYNKYFDDLESEWLKFNITMIE